MGFRIKNRCTTSVTLVLDGIAVRIPAGEVSAIHERSLFSGADCKLLNAGLLIMIPESGNDLRQPLDKNVVPSKASDRTVDGSTLTATDNQEAVLADPLPESDGPVHLRPQNEIADETLDTISHMGFRIEGPKNKSTFKTTSLAVEIEQNDNSITDKKSGG